MARTPTDPTKAQVWITKGLDDLDFEFYFPQGPKGDPGGFVAATSIGATFLDDLKTPGHYRQDNGNNATILAGYPIAMAAGFLEVLQAVTPGDLIQRFTPVAGAATGSGRAVYIRRYFNGSWGAWYAHTSSRVDQTAGRAIYQWDDVNGRDQLIWGDTGHRRVESDMMNGWTAAIASLRRFGNTVQLGLYTVSPSAKTADQAYQVPVGFRPGSYGGTIAFPCRSLASSGMGWISVDGGGKVYPDLTYTTFNGSIQLLTWLTTDSWPTTLPGTASGSIPNS